MIKTQTSGIQRITPPPHRLTVLRKNGTVIRENRTNGSAFDVRVGTASTLITHSGNDGRFRPCKHIVKKYRVRQSPANLGPLTGYRNAGQIALAGNTDSISYTIENAWVAAYRTGLTSIYNEVSSDLSDPGTQWAAWAQEALHDMLPSLKSGNNVLQSLIELKDFRHLLKGKQMRFVSRFEALRRTIVGVATDKSLSKLSRMYLSYSFAWRPFLLDAINLIESFDGFRRRWNEIIRRANRPQQSYWGRNIDGTNQVRQVVVSATPTQPALGPVGPSNVRYQVVRQETKPARYYAALRYRYPIPAKLLSGAGRLLALRDYLGTDLQLSTLWEVTPFSFIIDWVVNIGRALERLDVDNIQFQTEILEFCHSVKHQKAASLTLEGNHAPNWTPYYGAPIDVYTVERSYYERRVGIPDFRAAISTSGLSMREFLLSIGLVLAR